MTFAIIDFVFFVVIAIFIFSSLKKGFVNELFGKAAIIIALALSVILTPKLSSYVIATITNKTASSLVSFLLIFVVVFLIMRIIQHFVAKLFESEIMESLNKALALLLGIVEGLVVSAVIMTLINILLPAQAEELFTDSFFYNLLSGVVNFSSSYVQIRK